MTDRPASRLPKIVVALVALALAAASLFMLERARQGVSIADRDFAGTPATVYTPRAAPDAPLVVVAHGFAGSRQMMESISLTLARSGLRVVAFDFIGHGRTVRAMSRSVDDIGGTTQQLVDQTRTVVQLARTQLGADGPDALVGHSMATDIIVRAAQTLPDIAAVVAISMYSDAVTPDHPDRLLVISGAWESRLREVALEAVRQVQPGAEEGETVTAGEVARRAVAAPRVEHVGVLYSPTTLRETRDWLTAALDAGRAAPPAVTGPWIVALLAALVALAWPAAALSPRAPQPLARPIDARTFALLVLVPPVPAAGAAILVHGGIEGFDGFARLAAFFGVWGAAQLLVLSLRGWRFAGVHIGGVGLLLVIGLSFAYALDHYGASFVPSGERGALVARLALGTVPFMLADMTLARTPALWQRAVARLAALATFTAAIAAVPGELGLVFTVLPVLALFYVVYGLMGRWVALRDGPMSAGLALGILLAWAVAASTPLFAAP